MGYVKDMMLRKQEELVGEIYEDAFLAYLEEMEQIRNNHILADYVILSNGKRCYIQANCYPVDDVCECDTTW